MNAEQHEYLRHLPSFLRAYSSFAGQLESVPNELIVSLYHMCDIFILNFVRMSGYHRVQGSAAIMGLLDMLYQKGEGVLRKFLNKFSNIEYLLVVDIELNIIFMTISNTLTHVFQLFSGHCRFTIY
ncbi:hypothetical protein G6F57_022588 [Rhizopus arrhizus]|nr:hypothetical protein G6F57_022588 [Rhizopus arrhizus]